MSSSPTSQKSSLDDDSEIHENTPLKCPDLWLNDGNIVIRATHIDNSSVVLYRIHKSVLAMHSYFFRETFYDHASVLDNSSERVEGTPVLDMVGDSMEDVDAFLKTLYYPEFTAPLDRSASKSNFPATCAGQLRLSTKYIVTKLRNLIVSQFHDEYPCILDAWCQKENERKAACDSGLTMASVYPDPVLTISLAMNHEMHEILPIAFYDLTRTYNSPSITQGLHDDTALTMADTRRVVRGNAALTNALLSAVRAPFRYQTVPACALLREDGWGDRCSDAVDDPWTWACKSRLEEWWMHHFAQTYPEQSSDPFGWLAGAAEAAMPEDICAPCGSFMRSVIESLRESLWFKLPEFFDLTDDLHRWGFDPYPEPA
ncbi:hypothetical protein FA95DRAFT_1675991 [Auriscalpium vulgare]|uniref:Uncharacterized protein n=1 Tax=Auriscalpium vulgare TaxID=40419 RepID=A0ACB8S6V6_9AGAM|nr:hypothetical protein FA95DRAFT_1675991 [Auriscalpium vulgare]